MNIKIGNYRISRADDLNLIVEEKREVAEPSNPNLKRKNKFKYYFIAYCDTLERALNKVNEKLSSNIEANNLKECLIELKNIKKVISDSINSSTLKI